MVTLPKGLKEKIADTYFCQKEAECVLSYVPGELEAVLIAHSCPDCDLNTTHLTATKPDWSDQEDATESAKIVIEAPESDQNKADRLKSFSEGKVEIRDIVMRRVFVGGHPVGDPIAAKTKPQIGEGK
jgi:hypothetical protein